MNTFTSFAKGSQLTHIALSKNVLFGKGEFFHLEDFQKFLNCFVT